MTRISTHLRRNAIAYLALFFAVGGTAYAAATIGSAEVIDNSLRSVDLRNNDVRSADVRDDSLVGGGLQGADIAPGALTGADVADGGLTGADVATDSLTGADIDEGAIRQSRLGFDDSTSCDPNSTTFVTCASVAFTGSNGAGNDTMVIGALSWRTNTGGGAGTCELRLRGAGAALSSRSFGEVNNTTNTLNPHSGVLLHAGTFGTSTPNIIDLRCRENDDGIVFSEIDLGVVGLAY